MGGANGGADNRKTQKASDRGCSCDHARSRFLEGERSQQQRGASYLAATGAGNQAATSSSNHQYGSAGCGGGNHEIQQPHKVGSLQGVQRLGIIAGLAELERLDEIRTPYEPKERDLPGELELIELMNELPPEHKWSWPTWALITYGCRPAEVFSLKPKADGTAEVLTIKRKGMLPKRRTALALPLDERTAPEDKRIWLVGRPEEYDSLEAKRVTGAWGKWLVARSGGIQLYDLRHCWAIRSIRRNLNASLSAKTMGHSLDVHHRTYHRWLEQQDVAAVAATLQRGLMQ